MTTPTYMPEKKVHHGHNIRRFREMIGMKQDALAYELGDDWTQRKISQLEQKETIEPALLEQVAKVLKVPAEAFQNFDEDQPINIIGNTVTTVNDNATGQVFNNHCTFNPLDKVMELFERLLESEKEKTQLMKDILDKIK